MTRILVLALFIFVATACGGGSSATSFTTTAQIRDQLDAGGLPCAGYKELPPEKGTIEEATCVLYENRAVQLIVFHDQSERDLYIGEGCNVASGHSWAVTTLAADIPNVPNIAKALGVTSRRC